MEKRSDSHQPPLRPFTTTTKGILSVEARHQKKRLASETVPPSTTVVDSTRRNGQRVRFWFLALRRPRFDHRFSSYRLRDIHSASFPPFFHFGYVSLYVAAGWWRFFSFSWWCGCWQKSRRRDPTRLNNVISYYIATRFGISQLMVVMSRRVIFSD